MKLVKFETKMKVKEFLILIALFLQLMQLNVEASLEQEPNLLHGIFNRQLQDRKRSSNINMVRDTGRDNKICGQSDRVFSWTSSYNQMTTEEECKDKCLDNKDCVAVSVTSTSLVKSCVGCKVAATTNSNKNMKVFKKKIDHRMYKEKQECQGTETSLGKLSTIDECALRCHSPSVGANYFAYGTNDFGQNGCANGKCNCKCETISYIGGRCNLKSNKGYRLYRYGL